MARKIVQQNVRGRGRLRVAAVQMKFAPTIDENLAKIERLVGEAARGKADAVLLPECATTGYAYDFSSLTPAEIRTALAAVGATAARFRINVLAGSPVFRRGKLYNCLVVFDRQGAVTHCYAKCHLTEMDRSEAVIKANLDLAKATGVYAQRGLTRPPLLAPHWKRMVDAVRSQAAKSSLAYDLPSAVPVEGKR